MGENSAIEWTTHTHNPWIGCQRVSPGCDHCYAERLATTRLGVAWGPRSERRRTAESTRRQPLAWDRKAAREGKRPRVFCASLADWADGDVDIAWLVDLLDVVRVTTNLDWLLLTKRPQLILRRLRAAFNYAIVADREDLCVWLTAWLGGAPPANVWLGTTAEDQRRAEERIPHLQAMPAHVRFLSCEPLLGPVSLRPWLEHAMPDGGRAWGPGDIHWVIAGGESGPQARPSHPAWFRSLRDQCDAASVPFLFKQWGEHHPHGQTLADGSINALGNPDEPRWAVAGTRFGDATSWRVGKRTAGALLDGRAHLEFPKVKDA